MDLKSGYPYWAIRNGLMHAVPALDADHRCDVAVVGGGITGALIASELAAGGHSVTVLEMRDIGWGSTAASTALLQYEIDEHMVDLCKQFGEADAALAYRACSDAIDELEQIARDVGGVDFERCSSLYYASKPRHVSSLQDEMALRVRHGFDIEWLDAAHLQARYGLEAPGGMLSAQAARIDPYRMAYRLFARMRRDGVQVFDRTCVEDIEVGARRVRLRTKTGAVVDAGHVVMAAGYANQRWLPGGLARNRSSYAFITDPLDSTLLGELRKTLVWESARPYLYMRSTTDGRLLVGGEDDAVDVPKRRDARVESKSRTLIKRVHERFAHLELKPAFAWGGTFAETRDGLPFFGAHPKLGPRVQFAMAYGGNGITYSTIGAGLVRAAIERKRHPLAKLFGFERLDR